MAFPDDLVSTLSEAVQANDADAIRDRILKFKLTGHDLGECLIMASYLGNIGAMKVLLEYDADVHWKNEDGETAFSFACAYDQFDAARLLHQHGADINSVDSSGGTPLDWAVCHARPEFRAWLKDIGGRRNSDHEEWPWPPKTDGCGT
ncbi:ankyrin repeat domain-containing protein [Roseimaritima ulvae]|uniref:ankyrin repeat domain-containing protein n=1 Tax=Roseimaritima ulvae TaxID=980254 RepID=UPI000829713E|nr:ankyrin repeat domain-containing protein [Roseimaritima ulvae]